ncbi:hypothetical protein BMF94_3076 [Rhodotorula taiwanensis]|uniref:Uncharacterized protein n=1 Tax=Rhodotorula taiwanensis TaxID=741276 RepID=A0A2S5BAV0_9BASI|nr:hypothetical protein BMF94_3076 [Rhodotorula taiwanensis]
MPRNRSGLLQELEVYMHQLQPGGL